MTAARALSPTTMKQQQHPVSSYPPSLTAISSNKRNFYSSNSPASCSGSITKYRLTRKLPLMLKKAKTQQHEDTNNSIAVKRRKNAEKRLVVGSNHHHSSSASLLTNLRHNYASRGLSASTIPDRRRRDTIATTMEKPSSTDPGKISLTHAHSKPQSVSETSSPEKQKKIMKKKERTIPEDKQKEVNSAKAHVVRVPVKFGILYDSDDESMDVEDSTPSHRIATAFDSCGSIVSNDQRRHIRFDDYASVIEIPHRYSYTEQEREEIWNSLKVIRENAKRNKVEYSWEDWDWENVLEEDEFCFDLDGMKVHPAHACSF